MTIANVALTNTFDEWRIITNQLSVAVNDLNTINTRAIFEKTNASFSQANTSYNKANTANITADLAFGQANTARTHANTGHLTANAAFDQANTARDHANVAFAAANNAVTDFGPAFVQANTARSHANVSFDQANTARNHANVSFSGANLAFDQANTARDHANTGHLTANAGFDQANTARTHANTGHETANAAFAQANTARNHANSAFAAANASIQNTTTTLAGTLTLTGSLITNTGLDITGPYTQTIITLSGGGTAGNTVDCSKGNYFRKDVTAANTFSFANVASSKAYVFTFELNLSGSAAITWPTTVRWPANNAPTLTVGKTHLITFLTDDSGTTWRGSAIVDYQT